jgi:hypothetical protein
VRTGPLKTQGFVGFAGLARRLLVGRGGALGGFGLGVVFGGDADGEERCGHNEEGGGDAASAVGRHHRLALVVGAATATG